MQKTITFRKPDDQRIQAGTITAKANKIDAISIPSGDYAAALIGDQWIKIHPDDLAKVQSTISESDE